MRPRWVGQREARVGSGGLSVELGEGCAVGRVAGAPSVVHCRGEEEGDEYGSGYQIIGKIPQVDMLGLDLMRGLMRGGAPDGMV